MKNMEITSDLKEIMIIVPHEDDEILLAAGIIESALEQKVGVQVVMAGNGDYEGNDEKTGAVRLPETLAGLEVLGLAEGNVTFLGYADTGMEKELSFLHSLFDDGDENRVHESHCANHTYGMETKKDYHSERFGEPALYTKKNFKSDLKHIILEHKPELIFTTAEYDMHGDHSGLVLFLKEILGELRETGYTPGLFCGVVHSNAGDDSWPNRSGKKENIWDYAKEAEVIEDFWCPKDFNQGPLKWEDRISIEVPKDMKERDFNKNRKAKALACHKNAIKDDSVEFLYSFIKAEELFWKIL